MNDDTKRGAAKGGSKAAPPAATGPAEKVKGGTGANRSHIGTKSTQIEGAKLEGGSEEQALALAVAVMYTLAGWAMGRGRAIGVIFGFAILFLLQVAGGIVGAAMLSARHPRWLGIGLLFGSFLSCGSCATSLSLP